MKKYALWAAIAAAAAVSAAFVFSQKSGGDKKPVQAAFSAKPAKKAKTTLKTPTPARREVRVRKAFEDDNKTDLDFTDEELASITPELRKILEELQNAVDADDSKTVSRLSEQILVTMRKHGEDAVPPFVREAAVEAIGAFLPGSLADLVAYMKDSDPDVLQEVMDKFSEAIDDPALGDREISAILISVSKILTEEDAIDSLFMSIENDMRNSVAVETYLTLWETGSQEVKDRIAESVADFTGEDEITTPDQLKTWLEDNPDDEDDAEFYAGDKDDDDDLDDDGPDDD